MNKRRIITTFFSLFILTALTICLGSISTSAATIDDNKTFPDMVGTCAYEPYFSFETPKFDYDIDENIQVSYILNSETDYISDVNYVPNGFQVDHINIDNLSSREINIDLNFTEKAEKCNLDITITLSNSIVYEAKLYAIKIENKIYISPISFDDARVKASSNIIGSSQDCKKIYTVEEWNLLQSKTLNNVQDISTVDTTESMISPGEIAVSGELSWSNNSILIQCPLRKVRVVVFADLGESSICLGSVISGNDGSYVLRCTAPILEQSTTVHFRIEVYADDINNGVANVSVKDRNGNSYFATEEKNVSWDNALLSGVEINLSISMSTDTDKALQISQAIITARDYAQEMMGVTPDSITVYYPYSDDGNSCYYFDNLNTGKYAIYVSETVASTGGLYAYSSWDLLMHEYGHHVQMMVETSYFLNNSHSSYKNDGDIWGKDIGIKLAWQESWPTVFALLAQNYYYDSYLSGINTVGDSKYVAYNVSEYNIETTDVNLGEACEQSIMAVLWDLFDSANDTNDTISLGHTAFWSVTTESKAKTFSEFIDHFYERYPGYIDDIGLNLSHYGMATSVPAYYNSVAPTQSTPPTFTWTAQGGSTNYPNDKFQLIIYDLHDYEVFRSGELTTTSYTLTAEQWHDVLYSYGTTYKVAVSAIQSGNPTAESGLSVGPETGPYISGVASFTKPTASPIVYTGTILNNYTGKLKEITESLQPGQYMDYRVTFASTSRRIVQTFGTEDTYIYVYDSTGALVSSNDDGGYSTNSFINYYFYKDQQYTIRVKFYSADEAGKFKLSITPATIMVDSSYTNLTSYEAIYSIDNVTSVNMSVSLYPSNTTILTFTPYVTGDYTFTIASNLDTYIYVIDPRSTEAVIRNGDFNDDDGDGQNPLLTKRLTAGVPYYVIVSTYNPGSMTSPTQVTLIVSKEE